MEKNISTMELIKCDLAQKKNQIKELQLQNERIKEEIILLLKNVHQKEILDKVESILELLFGIDRTIEVMLHECADLFSLSDGESPDNAELSKCQGKIENGMAKIKDHLKKINQIIAEYRNNQTTI